MQKRYFVWWGTVAKQSEFEKETELCGWTAVMQRDTQLQGGMRRTNGSEEEVKDIREIPSQWRVGGSEITAKQEGHSDTSGGLVLSTRTELPSS